MLKKLILLIFFMCAYFLSTFPTANAAYIAIDPGHGGTDPGAVNETLELEEEDINLAISLKLNNLLLGSGLHKTIMTRTSDVGLTTNQRCDIANNAATDIFVSVHSNSATNSSANGAEVWYYSESSEGKTLATVVQEEIVKTTEARDRGIKASSTFTVLKNTNMTSIIVECGFINNNEEAKKLANPDYQQKVALGIFNGINRFFGVTPALKIVKPYTTVNPFSPNDDSYRDRTGFSYNLTMAARVTVNVYQSGKIVGRAVYRKPRKKGVTYYEVWDGKDLSGNLLGDGIYTYKIIAKTPFRRAVVKGTIEIKKKPSVTSVYTTVNPFSPNGDGNQDFTGFSYFIGADSKVSVNVYSGDKLIANVISKQRKIAGKRYYEIWNGKDNNDNIVSEGLYRYKIVATNRFGKGTAAHSVNVVND